MSFLDHPFTLGLLGLILGVAAGYGLWRWQDKARQHALKLREKDLLDHARREADNLAREARLRAEEEAFKLRESTEARLATQREELMQTEKALNQRELLLNQQMEKVSAAETSLAAERKTIQVNAEALDQQQQTLDVLIRQRRDQLQHVSHLNESEARQQLLKEIEMDVSKDASRMARRIMEDAKTTAEEKARRILSIAVQRYAGEHVNDISSATVALPGEEMKGRIIGREGRNIRAFEAATGVTVLIDDTPNAIVLSAFDPVRRVIARESMQRLLADGRIHPTRIEEVVKKVGEDMDETILRCGQEAIRRAGLAPFHDDITRLLGRLHFRHSYAQNVLDHSIEVSHLAGLLAGELGLDVNQAKRAGLLHDIGKAINHEVEGAHALVGAEMARRCGETEDVVNAIASHHDEAPHKGPLGILVGAADAMSASRPGARAETMTAYIRRVEALERIGNQIEGVDRCFAIQAGRELRVMVHPEEVTDEQAHAIARKISKRIEEELQYPGQIRVTVMRETRCVEYAK